MRISGYVGNPPSRKHPNPTSRKHQKLLAEQRKATEEALRLNEKQQEQVAKRRDNWHPMSMRIRERSLRKAGAAMIKNRFVEVFHHYFTTLSVILFASFTPVSTHCFNFVSTLYHRCFSWNMFTFVITKRKRCESQKEIEIGEEIAE